MRTITQLVQTEHVLIDMLERTSTSQCMIAEGTGIYCATDTTMQSRLEMLQEMGEGIE